MLTAETLSLKMKERIWLMKLKLAQKILCQEKSLAKAIYEEQLLRDWPGLSTEVKNICEAIGIENINNKKVEKEAMEEAIFFHNYMEMKQELEKCSKLEDIKHDDFTKLPDKSVLKSLDWPLE